MSFLSKIPNQPGQTWDKFDPFDADLDCEALCTVRLAEYVTTKVAPMLLKRQGDAPDRMRRGPMAPADVVGKGLLTSKTSAGCVICGQTNHMKADHKTREQLVEESRRRRERERDAREQRHKRKW